MSEITYHGTGKHAFNRSDPYRPVVAWEREPISYPATIENIIRQAEDLGIPEDAEVVVWTQYEEDGPGVFFQWPVFEWPEESNYTGKHRAYQA